MKFILAFILILIIGFFSFRITYAYLMSSQTIPHNTITTLGNATPSATLSVSPSISPSGTQTADHVVINEVSAVGGDDWIELLNPTSDSVDVSGWTITDNTSSNTIPLVNSIPSHGYAVIVASGSAVIVPVSAEKIQLNETSIGNGLNPSTDKVVLKNGTTTIDQMSFGSNTSIFTLPGLSGTQTLGRHPNGVDTDTASDWVVESSGSIGVANP